MMCSIESCFFHDDIVTVYLIAAMKQGGKSQVNSDLTPYVVTVYLVAINEAGW